MDSQEKYKQLIEDINNIRLNGLDINYQHNTALLVIDVEKEFCKDGYKRGNKETDITAGNIQKITPLFRELSIPVYAIYYPDFTFQKPDFYKFQLHEKDILILKKQDSAFKGSNIDAILRERGIKNLLLCGFNKSSCVNKTGRDAVEKGYNTFLLNDLSANDNECNEESEDANKRNKQAGIILTSAKKVLSNIQFKKNYKEKLSDLLKHN